MFFQITGKKKTSLFNHSYSFNQRKMVIYSLLEYKIWKTTVWKIVSLCIVYVNV